MNKNKLLAILCLASAIVLGVSSASFTANLFMSVDETNFKYVLLLVAISIDFGKFAFAAIAAFQFAKEKYVSSITYTVLAILCIVTSFLASMSYDLNQANTISNDTITSSGAYQRQTELFKSTNDGISTTKTDIAAMKANRKDAENQIRNDYQQRIDNAKKLKYLTTPKIGVNDLTSERDSKISGLDADIKAKESTLNTKQSELSGVNNGFGAVAGAIKTTRGVNALATWINPSNPDDALGKINFAKNILIEICAIAFSVGFGVLVNKSENFLVTAPVKIESETTTDSTSKPRFDTTYKPTFESKTTDTTYPLTGDDDKPKRTIGFHANDTGDTGADGDKKVVEIPEPCTKHNVHEIDNAVFNIYLDYIYSKVKSDKSIPGYQTTGKDLGLGLDFVRKLKNHAEQLNILESDADARKTFILKPRNEIKF